MGNAVHRSRVDLWVVAVWVYASFWLFHLALELFDSPRLPLLEIPAGVALIAVGLGFLWVVVALRYEIGDGEVVVRCVPFTGRVPFDEIEEVRPVYGLHPGPALSVNRLLLACRDPRNDTVVSPRDKREFLDDLERAVPELVPTDDGLVRRPS